LTPQVHEKPEEKSAAPAPTELEKLRHSCAHVMAQAVQELFPGTKITIGPAIENGFYYDFDSKHPFTPEDLKAIEKRMRQIAEGNHAFSGVEISYEESRAYWEKRGETYKVEILDGLKGQRVTHYTHDTFTDLCRGGHSDNTKAIRHFKLLSVAGAYWRGNEKNPMLQRIYGTAFPTKVELDDYLKQLEEAKKRDHRKLGVELDLFSVHEESGAGLIHWHPKGATVRYQVELFVRELMEKAGYSYVVTPHINSEKLYEVSGHLENYSQLMYAPMEIEGNPYRVKPMNCPNHILIFKSGLHSYRELPIRYAEFGTVYRFERSGVLSGLFRVRGFTQDDAHIFCRADQVKDEVKALIGLISAVHGACGFTELQFFLSTRPAERVGEDLLWDKAETALTEALKELNIPYEVDPGAGAFYGPKIDVLVKDAIGRSWQLSTVQLDFNLPMRFDVKYRNSEGGSDYAVMIHRALTGSLERFMGVLIEHFGGAFPTWLAPVQAQVITVSEDSAAYGEKVLERLRAAGLRVDSDLGPDKLGGKIRDASKQKIPYLLILGAKEAEAGTVSVRVRGGVEKQGVSLDGFLESVRKEIAERSQTLTA